MAETPGRANVPLASRALLALADLAPTSEAQQKSLSIPTEWFTWLPARSVDLFATYATAEVRFAPIPRSLGDRLASVDLLRPEQRSLRVGWLFVAGRTTDDAGRHRRVLHPLVTIPVRVPRAVPWATSRLVPAGDVEISELVTDPLQRRHFEADLQLGGGSLAALEDRSIPVALLARLTRLQAYAREVASAAGLAATRVVTATDGPDKLLRTLDELVIVAGVAVYAIHEVGGGGRAESLRSWASARLGERTAFHALYDDVDPGDGAPPASTGAVGDVGSPQLLTPAQCEAVRRSRSEEITVISGAPGTGKSHTIVAVACDALARGESVLVAAKADATVDALLDLFERSPGPDPVVFGSHERRDALAARLAGGQLTPTPGSSVEASARAHADARDDARRLRETISALLAAEELLAGRGDRDAEALADAAPGLFSPEVDLPGAAVLLETAQGPGGGWWRRRKRRRALATVLATARAAPGTTPDELARAIALATARREASWLSARGGLEIADAWDRLRQLDDAARRAHAEWLRADARSSDRLNSSTLPAIGALATALRSGRAARRELLGRLDRRLTRALPLWLGSLPDIDDMLPAVAGLFDLVILDEASSIDQPLAAPALLRGRRGVVVGDPRQLRHVSFLSDARISDVLAAHAIDTEAPLLAARLDVRRNSAFDVAAGVSPVVVLDEHFRSDPHLVEFVASRLYRGSVKVATRTPTSSRRDCVRLRRLRDADRDADGVVGQEVTAVVAELAR
ncbi:MAG TPA: AAA domain-containing protein, partial [Acidimicrobiales bacterium]|nr:AAA domain-containing protein [Acidimicrobiales bacterium]